MKKYAITFEIEAPDARKAMEATIRMIKAAKLPCLGSGINEVPTEQKRFGFQVVNENKN